MLYEEPNRFSEELINKIDEDLNNKTNKLNKLRYELNQLQKQQTNDVFADFPTRLGRYVRIKLIKFTLNNFTL